MLQSDQTDASHTKAADELRTKRLWKEFCQHNGIDPIVDQNAAIDESLDDGEVHGSVGDGRWNDLVTAAATIA